MGWYVEPDQPKSVLDKCSQMLTDLRPFWFDALPTAVTLMKQFADDATAYLEVWRLLCHLPIPNVPRGFVMVKHGGGELGSCASFPLCDSLY